MSDDLGGGRGSDQYACVEWSLIGAMDNYSGREGAGEEARPSPGTLVPRTAPRYTFERDGNLKSLTS